MNSYNKESSSLVKFNNNILFDEFSDAFGEITTSKSQVKGKSKGRTYNKNSPSKENNTSKLFKESLSKSNSASSFNSPLKMANNSFVSSNVSPRKKTRPLVYNLNSSDYSNHINPLSSDFVVNKQPPQTPKKQRRLCPFATRIMEIAKRSEHTLQTKDGLVNFIIKAKPMGAGTYSNVYEILSEEPLYEKYCNDELVVKFFQPEVIARDNCSIEGYYDHMIKQYNELKTIGFPHCAEIMNAETAKDNGFIIMKKIPNPFQINFDPAAKIHKLDEKTINHLNQIKAAFETATRNGICVDYKKDNVGIVYKDTESTDDPYGEIFLLDYREKKANLMLYIDLAVQSFSKNEQGECSQAIYDYLMPASVAQKYRSQVVDGVFKSLI